MRRPTPEKAGPHQESVWDYPRPPRLEQSSKTVRIEAGREVIAESSNALRLLETSHPPGWYIPPGDVRRDLLERAQGRSFCEFKGVAAYWDVVVAGERYSSAAWSYPDPTGAYAPLKDHFSFYPGRVDACYVDGERVTPQEGDFYGGWITSDVVGPFKGGPGTMGW